MFKALMLVITLLLPLGAMAQISDLERTHFGSYRGGNSGADGTCINCVSWGRDRAPEYWRPIGTREEREAASAELENALARNIVAGRAACPEHEEAVRRYNAIAASAYFRFTHNLVALNEQATLNEGFLAITGGTNHLNACKGRTQ